MAPFRTALLCLLLSLSASVSAQPLKVFFAGFAFVGNAADIKASFPFSNKLLQEKGPDRPLLEAELSRRLGGVKNASFELMTDRLGVRRTGESVALAYALEWENVSVEKLGDINKVVVDVHAQILVFDFEEKKVISVHPVAVQIRDAVRGEVTEARKLALVRDIYYGPGQTNILDQFAQQLAALSLKQSFGHHLRVANVVLDDGARATVVSGGSDPAVFARFVGQSFSRFLSQNMRVSVLPYATGQAIGGKMPASFANGDSYILQIPDADYVVNLRISGFKKVLVQETASEKIWAYASYAMVTLEQPELAKRYLDSQFKFGVVKRVPLSVLQTDDWTAYQESLFTLFDQVTQQLAKPSADWTKKWADGAATTTRLAEASKVIERCR
jgi:hypothetical protein